ncbi:MAG: hypothetical protein NTX25_13410 [Proteobacteria bacterium]|nr:hypothetical protein [Pseudomonadota bacterium]
MKSIRVLASSMLLCVGCAAAPDEASTSTAGPSLPAETKPFTLTDGPASLLLGQLSQLKLTYWFGALHLRAAADSLRCSAAVVPQPIANCSVTANGQEVAVPAEVSQTLFALLRDEGAQIPSDTLGTSLVGADNIFCDSYRIYGGETTCTFTVPVN